MKSMSDEVGVVGDRPHDSSIELVCGSKQVKTKVSCRGLQQLR